MTTPGPRDSAAADLDRHALAAFAAATRDAGPTDALPFGPEQGVRIFDAQALSRHLDLAARALREQGVGYYTIGSAGHESNAAVAEALRVDDPALLHYRSGALYLARAARVPGHDGVRDVVLSLRAAAADPISGGRHKVFGHGDLHVIPQTSTIASHVPRAVGLAFAVERAARLGRRTPWPADCVVVCSLGDASVNHSTAQGGLNTAAWVAHQGLPLPLLVVCEDNGVGISVPSPPGWVASALQARPQLRYVSADGADAAQTYAAATDVVEHVRATRRPAVLHLRTVRYLGHAGSDAEAAYRPASRRVADLEHDPLVATGRLLVGAGVLTGPALVDRYEAARERVACAMRDTADAPRLTGRAQVMAPLTASHPAEAARVAAHPPEERRRERVHGGRLPEQRGGLTLAASITAALVDVLASQDGAVVFGEDVAVKGGVYGLTRGLRRAFGAARVFDTLLDEQAILGLALGAGLADLLPIPEIQYLAYLHNAEDQLRGEAATLQFFSGGRYRNPMVVRVAGYGYQRGFGGHFHNDDAVAVLRDIPGIVVASPSRPGDAAAMLRTCVASALVDGSVCVVLEPIALYHTRDLLEDGDDGWLDAYAAPATWGDAHVPIGRARTYGDGRELTIVTFGNGVPMSLRVANMLASQGIGARVLDLRWLVPLPVDDLLREATATGRVLVVDETRRSGGVSEGVVTALVDRGFPGRIARVASADSFVPIGPAAELVLLSEDEILAAAHAILGRG